MFIYRIGSDPTTEGVDFTIALEVECDPNVPATVISDLFTSGGI